MSLELDPEVRLQAGLSALKQGHYGDAIALLMPLVQTEGPPADRVKAQIGLVRAYIAQAQWLQARQGCQRLLQVPNARVRQWAEQQLRNLPTSAPPAETDLSGFQPLEPAPDAGLSAAQSTDATVAPKPSMPTAAERVDAVAAEALSAAPPSPQTPSLFHYQVLNQAGSLESALEADVSAALPPEPPTAQAPTPHSPAAPTATPPATAPSAGRPADRLKTGRSLGKLKQGRLWLVQAVTAGVLFGLLDRLLHILLRSINGYLRFLDRLLPIWVPTVPAFYRDHTWTLLAGLGALALASPWLWDALLRLSAGLQPLSTRQLTTHSDEAVQGLRRRCLQHNWPFPRLGLLPTSAPLIFSYGWLPRYARLVVSQGLLEQLAADEIAALYAYETSHWRHWDWPLFSLQGLLLQGLHQGYWRLAGWGNRQPLLVKFAAGVLANLSYGLFWLLQKGGVWAARVRVYYCDRTAVEITGNPNGLGRALDKLALGLSQAVDQQGYTPPLIESLDLLLPVGLADAPGTATPPGVNRFAWDALNPLRGWLSINQGHPPLGDRLQLLGRYARYWRLAPELDFEALFKQYGTPTPRLSRTDWRELLLTGAPWFGAAAGGAIALLLWGVGAIARAANYPPLDWLYQDSSLLKSGLLLGLGTGLVLRFNRLFPDLPTTLPATAEQLPDWLSQPDLSPLASLPTQLSGELLTRPGIANWLSQEFWLRTPYGLIKLQAGPEILSQPASDHTSSVQVRGWFRRGHRAWIDLDRLRRTGQPDLKGRLPLWTVGLLALFWGNGLWILFRGTP